MSAGFPSTIKALRAALAAGDMSLTAAVQQQVETFGRAGQLTQAVVNYLPVLAPESATALPLAGVGLAHKDIFDLKDHSPGLGRDSGALQPGLAQARVLTKLEQAGAINLGTLAMAEDACSATAQTEKLPTPINPLGEQLAVGGSSSGSAVAVASGMVYASLGTDTAGSVRIPAMTCGVMGLKTTHGLIDRQGMTLLCPSLDSIGILGRSTDDLARFLQVLAPGLKGASDQLFDTIKVGYWLDGAELMPDIYPVVSSVMRHYGQTPICLTEQEHRAHVLQELVMAYEVGQTHCARIAAGQACRAVTGLGAYGLTVPKAWWRQALRQRADHLRAFIDQAFNEVDVLLAPLQTASIPKTCEVYLGQPEFEPAKLLGLHRYCGWVNYLGLPALSMPVGTHANGLPISIQLIGKPYHELQLLAVGQQLQHDIYGEQGMMPALKIEGQSL